jgi:hypothetical protein
VEKEGRRKREEGKSDYPPFDGRGWGRVNFNIQREYGVSYRSFPATVEMTPAGSTMRMRRLS